MCGLLHQMEVKALAGATGGPKRPSLRKPAAKSKQAAAGHGTKDGSKLQEPVSEQASPPAPPGPMCPTHSYTSPYSPTASQAYSPSDAIGASFLRPDFVRVLDIRFCHQGSCLEEEHLLVDTAFHQLGAFCHLNRLESVFQVQKWISVSRPSVTWDVSWEALNMLPSWSAQYVPYSI